MSEWDFSDFASKGNLLRTVRAQSDQMLALASAPAAWEAPTASGHWQVRDIIGHLVDTTEGYFAAIRRGPVGRHRARPARRPRHGRARRRGGAGVPRDPAGRAADPPREGPGRDARDHRGPRRGAWSSFIVPHKYMGPLPAFFYPVAQLVDYAVHTLGHPPGQGRLARARRRCRRPARAVLLHRVAVDRRLRRRRALHPRRPGGRAQRRRHPRRRERGRPGPGAGRRSPTCPSSSSSTPPASC